MAIYEYTAVDQNQYIFSGIYTDIDNVRSLREELAKMGYRLLKVSLLVVLRGISFSWFCRQGRGRS